MPRLPRFAIAVAGLLVVAAACGDEPTRGQASFCRQLLADRAAIDTPAGSTAAARLQVERFRALDRLAPEAIRDEWHAVTELMALASTADLATAAGRASLNEAALGASRAADTVRAYVLDVCGVDLTGTVVTSPAAAPDPTPSTGAAPTAPGTAPTP
ncbi:MAG: hypothetical protein ACKO91_03445 [Acidimicrobiales bacterium]